MQNSNSNLLAKSVFLLLIASALYIMAMLTNYWFTMPPHSYHGLWSVTFCDFLRCQTISTVDDEAPGWYRILQLLSVSGFVLLICSVFLLTSSVNKYLPAFLVCQDTARIMTLCVISVICLSSTLVLFYINLLLESGPRYQPYFSWSSLAAFLACLLESGVVYLVVQNH